VIWYRRDEIKPTGMSFALAVNDHGHMVGEGVDDSDGFNRTMLWKDGGRIVLPALPGSKDKRTSAEAINNKGQVVGGSSYGSNGVTHAALWVDGTVTDLGALGDDAGPNSYAYDINRYGDTRYILESARGITDGGTIVANATADDGSSTQRAFRLIPRTVAAQ
jgi:probable HAF family extracellular repeat protein